MLVGDVIAQMGLDSRQYERDLNRMESLSQKKASTIGSIFKNALSVTIGMGMFEAVKQGFMSIAKEALNYNSMLEQANIGFSTMLGSVQKASSFLKQIADFAAKTPFEFPELLQASKRMLAYGFAAREVLPMMTAVGNATAALGLGSEGIGRIILALGQMRAKSKVTGEEMRQLTETGIPAWEILSKAMGKPVAEIMKMSEKGLIPAGQAIQDFIDGLNQRFPDMMKKMENTWQGVTSTIKDVWRMTMGALTSTLFQNLVGWLKGVRDWASNFYDVFQRAGLSKALAVSFGSDFASVVDLMSATIRGFISILKGTAGFIRSYWEIFRIAVITFVSYTVAVKTATAVTAIFVTVTAALNGSLATQVPILSFVSKAIGIYRVQMGLAAAQGAVMSGVLGKLRVALFAVWSALGPIGWAVLALTGVLAAGTALWSKYNASLQKAASGSGGTLRVLDALDSAAKGVTGSTKDQTDATKDQADALNKAGKAANKNLQSFDELHQLQSEAAGGGAGDIPIMDIPAIDPGMMDVGGIGGLDGTGFSELFDMSAELPPLKERLAGFWEWLKQGAVDAWGSVKTAASTAWDAVKQKWEGLNPVIQTIIAVIVGSLIPAIVRSGIIAMISAAKHVAAWVLIGASAVKNAAIAVAQFAVMIAKWAWAGIQSMIHAAKMAAAWIVAMGPVAWVTAAVIALAVLIVYYWDDIKKWTIKIWGEISAWLVTSWDKIKQYCVDTWDAMVLAITTAWDAVKTKTIEIWEAIKTFFVQIWDGMKTAVGNSTDAIKTKITTVWETLKTFLSTTWSGIKTTASTVWDGIKKAITDPIESAKKTVLGIIDTIVKAFANMKITIPKPKLPSVSVSTKTKTIAGQEISYPDFDVDWFANGGIFSTPSIIGVGEAGTEVVTPLDKLTGIITDAFNQSMMKVGAVGASGDVYVYIGNEQIDAYIRRSQDRRSIRSNGR